MGEIVNLRAARKRKARAEKERRADENRNLYGRTAAEKAALAAGRERERAAHDGHRRVPAAAPGSDPAAPGDGETP